jgi:acyl transferase domain-containing protein
MTGRYPQAEDIEAFWDNLLAGRDAISEIPADRWRWQDFANPAEAMRYSYSRWGGYLEGIDQFDPIFFGILPREAAAIDPQERLFLECAWTLLEEAGSLGSARHEPETGVFVGAMNSGYDLIGAARWQAGGGMSARSAHWSIANRVSYFFDFHGPSFAIDSACSSSLLAIHLATESIRRGECAAAIAGGVSLLLHPTHYVQLCAARMLSRDGRCKTFDARADGFVPGEGVGAVLLKPLESALKDGDTIWAVLKGGHVRSEGRTMGYAVPSPASQADLIASALQRADVDATTVGYVETHGTGTALGDPIEITGLTRAYGVGCGDRNPRYVGSVKSNIGHLEGAAGIAGFTKAVLQLRCGLLAPTINLQHPNTKIDFAQSPFQPVLRTTEFPVIQGPRRSAVSSFGAGGTDVHLVIEEYRPSVPSVPPLALPSRAFLLSARNASQLDQLAHLVTESLADGRLRDAALPGVLYASQVGRKEFRQRLGVLGNTRAELSAGLADFLEGRPSPTVFSGEAAPATSREAPFDPADEQAAILEWCKGQPVNWVSRWRDSVPIRAVLPAYPMARRSYWPGPVVADASASVSG